MKRLRRGAASISGQEFRAEPYSLDLDKDSPYRDRFLYHGIERSGFKIYSVLLIKKS